MSWEHIRLDINDGIATITLDRPAALNAFAGSMRTDLLAAIKRGSDCSRVVVITGAGEAFCAGGDVKFMANARDSDVEPLIGQGKEVVRLLRSLPIPTLAAINGVAVGAGLGLALACDLRIAIDTARLGATFSRIGLHPDWGTSYFLTRLAGAAAARDLVFSGRLIDAVEALSLGLVNRVVPRSQFGTAVKEKALAVRDAAPLSISWAKRTLNLAETASLDAVLEKEQEAQLECFRSDDAKEGLNALLDKRVPFFRGK